MWQEFLRNPWTPVYDLDHGLVPVTLESHVNARRARRVGHGIRQHVQEHLLQPLGIRLDHKPGLHGFQLDCLIRLHHCAGHLNTSGDYLVERHAPDFQAESALLQTLHIEQILDQSPQPPHLLQGARDVVVRAHVVADVRCMLRFLGEDFVQQL
jgi:hypothetical protein